MHSTSINIWLSKYCDFEFVAFQKRSVSNLIIHRNILAKAAIFRSALGPYDFSTKEKFIHYANLKNLWEEDYRKSVVDIFTESLNASNLSPIYASTLERFFYPCIYGCLDAIFFGSSIRDTDTLPEKITIAIGGDYQLEELLALIWWLGVINVCIKDKFLEYVYLSKDAKAVKISNIYELIEILSKSDQISPAIEGDIPEEVVSGSVKTCVWWTSALKFPHGWNEVIQKKYGENFIPLRITEVGFLDNYPMPCIGLTVGKSLSQTQIIEIFDLAVKLISTVNFNHEDFNAEFSSYKKIISHFIKASISVVVTEKLSSTVQLINQRFNSLNVIGGCTVAAPFLESIAINEWLGRRCVKPIMLPHSFTSSHEYPPSAYSRALTFIKSNDIMKSVNDFPGTQAAEDLVCFSEIESIHISALKPKIRINNLIFLFNFSFYQLPFLLLNRIRAKIFYKSSAIKFKKIQQKKLFKLGFLLNAEHSQFSAIVNFNKHYEALGCLLDSALLHNKSSILIIRHKPGWTCGELIFKCIKRKSSALNKILLSPEGFSLSNFGKSCDCVLFVYATSAVLELMLQGVPAIKVLMPEVVMTEGQYIELPSSVVPEMTIDEIMLKKAADELWLANLGLVQSEWVSSRMM